MEFLKNLIFRRSKVLKPNNHVRIMLNEPVITRVAMPKTKTFKKSNVLLDGVLQIPHIDYQWTSVATGRSQTELLAFKKPIKLKPKSRHVWLWLTDLWQKKKTEVYHKVELLVVDAKVDLDSI